jgi:hypothetical protein
MISKYIAKAIVDPYRTTKCTVINDHVWFEEYEHRGALAKRMCIARADVPSSELLLALLRNAMANEVVVATTEEGGRDASKEESRDHG